MKKILKHVFNYMNILIIITILVFIAIFTEFKNVSNDFNIPKLENLFFSVIFIPLLILIYLKLLTIVFKNKIIHFILNIIATIYSLLFSFFIYIICIMHVAIIKYVYLF